MIDLLLTTLCITAGIVLGVVIVLFGVIRLTLWYCIKFRNMKKAQIREMEYRKND